MFLGEYSHSLDDKGRLVLPARFRDKLAQAFLSSHRDTCLALWTPEEFEEQAAVMKAKLHGDRDDRSMARVFFASAQEANPDRQGRLTLSPKLREMANIHLDSEVIVTGVGAYVEIWDAATWAAQRQSGIARMQDVNMS